MRSRSCLILLLCLAGCARTMLESSIVDDTGLLEDELEFWSRLEERRVVTNNDALHGLYLMADGSDPYVTYEQRLGEARQRGWLRGSGGGHAHPR